jgi:hypothetical protein
MAEVLANVIGAKGDPKRDQFLSFLKDHGILATTIGVGAGAIAAYAAHEYSGFGLLGCGLIGATGAVLGVLGASLAYMDRPDFIREHPWIAGISYVAVAGPLTIVLTSETGGLINMPTAMMIGTVAGLAVVAMESAAYNMLYEWWNGKKRWFEENIEDPVVNVTDTSGAVVNPWIQGNTTDISLELKNIFNGELDDIKSKQDVQFWINNSPSKEVRDAAAKVLSLWDAFFAQGPNNRSEKLDYEFRKAVNVLRYAVRNPSTDDADADARFTYVDHNDVPIVQEDVKKGDIEKAAADAEKAAQGVEYDAEEEFEGDKGNGITAPTAADLAETERIKQEMLDRAKAGPGGNGWSSNGGPGFKRY